MTDILDRVSDLAIAPLTNTPLTSTDTTFEIAGLAGDITAFADPGAIGYYAWVWAREPNFGNVGDAQRAGVAERVRVTARNLGPQTLTVTRGASPIDLNVVGTTYWLVASMNAELIEQIDDRIFDFSGGNLVTTKRVDMLSAEIDDLDIRAVTPGVGTLNFFEDTANGPEAVTLQAPAGPLAGSFAMTLLSALPGGPEFLTIDAAGIMGTSPATLVITLDDAYDAGGAGLGRFISDDNGPVELNGGDGLQLTATAPQLLWETAGAVYNWRHVASAVDTMLFQRGDQDADVSDDVFVNMLALAGVTRRVGVNIGSPQDTLHVLEITAASRLRLQTSIDEDSSILLQNIGAPTWEFGYDTSANGFVIGRLSFANPILHIEDAAGQISIGEGAAGAGARVGITASSAETTLSLLSAASTLPSLAIARDNGLAAQSGDISLSQRTVNASGAGRGQLWYANIAGGRVSFQLNTGLTGRGFVALNPTFGSDFQDQIDAGGVANFAARGYCEVRAFSGVADDLDTIDATDYAGGDFICLRAFPGDTITLRHGIDNLSLDGSVNQVLTNGNMILLVYVASSLEWRQVSPMTVLP